MITITIAKVVGFACIAAWFGFVGAISTGYIVPKR